MKLEHYPAEKLQQEILALLSKHLDLSRYQVFFFGSRVTGKATERADIDVGIQGPGPIPAKLWLQIQEEIDNLPTLYKVEIVDFTRVSSLFRQVALQAVEPISLPQ